jgi:hypothetical protein
LTHHLKREIPINKLAYESMDSAVQEMSRSRLTDEGIISAKAGKKPLSTLADESMDPAEEEALAGQHMRTWTQLKHKMPLIKLANESMDSVKQKMSLIKLADESMDSAAARNASQQASK